MLHLKDRPGAGLEQEMGVRSQRLKSRRLFSFVTPCGDTNLKSAERTQSTELSHSPLFSLWGRGLYAPGSL